MWTIMSSGSACLRGLPPTLQKTISTNLWCHISRARLYSKTCDTYNSTVTSNCSSTSELAVSRQLCVHPTLPTQHKAGLCSEYNTVLPNHTNRWALTGDFHHAIPCSTTASLSCIHTWKDVKEGTYSMLLLFMWRWQFQWLSETN